MLEYVGKHEMKYVGHTAMLCVEQLQLYELHELYGYVSKLKGAPHPL